jgi:hypothetical protein
MSAFRLNRLDQHSQILVRFSYILNFEIWNKILEIPQVSQCCNFLYVDQYIPATLLFLRAQSDMKGGALSAICVRLFLGRLNRQRPRQLSHTKFKHSNLTQIGFYLSSNVCVKCRANYCRVGPRQVKGRDVDARGGELRKVEFSFAPLIDPVTLIVYAALAEYRFALIVDPHSE